MITIADNKLTTISNKTKENSSKHNSRFTLTELPKTYFPWSLCIFVGIFSIVVWSSSWFFIIYLFIYSQVCNHKICHIHYFAVICLCITSRKQLPASWHNRDKQGASVQTTIPQVSHAFLARKILPGFKPLFWFTVLKMRSGKRLCLRIILWWIGHRSFILTRYLSLWIKVLHLYCIFGASAGVEESVLAVKYVISHWWLRKTWAT